ncbi:hypothetical protein BX661DRAFT_196251 [Kickxella alabastrina]|uniref:uncharacterized protein n=1 Tax=Kickxella alabastrina TaxID=61397 RepID=UPI00221F759B|nr:uncharacterized protein BX661DRAFT_196251 [Kickxella alabastrina]KAI7833738.1 hypothetical protein BX661DRAFT_196251 [Kickxella alabastrina]
MSTRKLSGLQKDESRPRFRAFARQEFDKNIGQIKRTDVKAIEYLLRIGRRRMEQYMGPNVSDISII